MVQVIHNDVVLLFYINLMMSKKLNVNFKMLGNYENKDWQYYTLITAVKLQKL